MVNSFRNFKFGKHFFKYAIKNNDGSNICIHTNWNQEQRKRLTATTNIKENIFGSHIYLENKWLDNNLVTDNIIKLLKVSMFLTNSLF